METGLLISSGTSSQASTPQVYAPGENVPQGNTQLTMTRLVDMRQVSLPGLNGQNPEWARRGTTLRYHGTQNFTNPVAPATGSMDAGVAMQVRFPEVGEDWAHYIAELQSQMPGAPTSRVEAVCGPTGGYWIAPDALKGLRANQVLDEDRVTRFQTRVVEADGRQVTIVAEGPGMRTTSTYDTRSGALVEFMVETPASGYTTKLRLDQVP